MCGALTPKPLRSWVAPSGRYPPWTHPWPLSVSQKITATGDCDHVFTNKSSKKVYWWHFAHCHSRFQRQYIDLSVKIWCPGLVKRNYGQLGHNAHHLKSHDNNTTQLTAKHSSHTNTTTSHPIEWLTCPLPRFANTKPDPTHPTR